MVGIAALALPALFAGPARAALAETGIVLGADPVDAIVRRAGEFLHRGEVEGVTRDPRKLGNLPEEIRLSVVPQLLGFAEIYRVYRNPIHRQDIVDRADYLLASLPVAASGTLGDGMLASALLNAWEATGDERYAQAAAPFLDRFLITPPTAARLNWGLMGAMALADGHRLTGRAELADKARAFLINVARDQLPDGSFPHYCPGARDIHYSAWMAMELILIRRGLGPDPVLDRMLERLDAFLRARIDPRGISVYEEGGGFGARLYYYSLGSGCGGDYDTRGWVNEFGYLALLFAQTDGTGYFRVLDRLRDLQDMGAFPDKWDYFASTADPIYPWASASRSVIRTSVVFWSLASVVALRETRGMSGLIAGSPQETEEVPTAGAPLLQATSSPPGDLPRHSAAVLLGPAYPNPASGESVVEFRNPARTGDAIVVDALGRRVRDLGRPMATEGRFRWDGRDDLGRPVAPGLYFLRFRDGADLAVARLVRVD